MEKAAKNKSVNKRLILVIAVVAVAIAAFLLFQSGMLGGNSCNALLRQYNKWAQVEDYAKVSDYYGKLMQKGCEF